MFSSTKSLEPGQKGASKPAVVAKTSLHEIVVWRMVKTAHTFPAPLPPEEATCSRFWEHSPRLNGVVATRVGERSAAKNSSQSFCHQHFGTSSRSPGETSLAFSSRMISRVQVLPSVAAKMKRGLGSTRRVSRSRPAVHDANSPIYRPPSRSGHNPTRNVRLESPMRQSMLCNNVCGPSGFSWHSQQKGSCRAWSF